MVDRQCYNKCRVTNINKRISIMRSFLHLIKKKYIYTKNNYDLYLMREFSKCLKSLEYSLYKKNLNERTALV